MVPVCRRLLVSVALCKRTCVPASCVEANDGQVRSSQAAGAFVSMSAAKSKISTCDTSFSTAEVEYETGRNEDAMRKAALNLLQSTVYIRHALCSRLSMLTMASIKHIVQTPRYMQ